MAAQGDNKQSDCEIRRSLGTKIHCLIMEILQCQDKEIELDSRGRRELLAIVKQSGLTFLEEGLLKS